MDLKVEKKKQDLLFFVFEQFVDGTWLDLEDEIEAVVNKLLDSNAQQLQVLMDELISLGLKKDKVKTIKEEIHRLQNDHLESPQEKLKKEYILLWQFLQELEQKQSLQKDNVQKIFQQLVKLIQQNDNDRKIKLFVNQMSISSQDRQILYEKLNDYMQKKQSSSRNKLEIENNQENKFTKNISFNQLNQKSLQYLSNQTQRQLQNIQNQPEQQYFGDKNDETPTDCGFNQSDSNLKTQQYFSDQQMNQNNMINVVSSNEKFLPIKILQQFPENGFDQVYIRNILMQENVNKLIQSIQAGSCNCVGFLGDFRIAFKILSCMAPNLIQVNLENEILDQFDLLVAYTDGNTVFMIYQDSKYLLKENSFENNDRALYIRYILDICQVIVLCINEESVINWSDANPFQNNISTKIKFIEDKQLDFVVKKIETEFYKQPKKSQIVKCSLDCQEIIYTWSEEDSQQIYYREYQKNKNKIEKIFEEINFENYKTSKLNFYQQQELKQIMQLVFQSFIGNKEQIIKIEEIFINLTNQIQKYQTQWLETNLLETSNVIKQNDFEILLKSFLDQKDQILNANDIIQNTLIEINQKFNGYCLGCITKKWSWCNQCVRLQIIFLKIIQKFKQNIDFKQTKQISFFQIVDEYKKNQKLFVKNLENKQYEEFIIQFEESFNYFVKEINKFKQKIFIKKIQEDNVTQLLKEKIVEHAINTFENQINNNWILLKNIQQEFNTSKEKVLQVLEQQLNEEQKKIIILRPLINKFVSKKKRNNIRIIQNLYDIKLPKEAHSILNYFCFDSEIDYIATCNSYCPKEDQKLTIWKVRRNFNGNQQQIFGKVFTMNSSDVCIHINSKSKQWIVFDNINKNQAMGEIKQDYSFSQEMSFSNVYASKIKETGHNIRRVDNCFILNGIDDKIFIYEKQKQQYYAVSLDSDSIEIKVFQLCKQINNEIVNVENLKIYKVFNCLSDKVYVFETEDSLKITDSNYRTKFEINFDRLQYQDFKIIDNQTTVMIIVIYQGCNIDSYVITNELDQQQILVEKGFEQEAIEKRIGNPIIDSLVESIKNYGQNFTELGCPQQNNLFCFYEEANQSQQSSNLSKKINQYLKECFQALQINYQITYEENQNSSNIVCIVDQIQKFLEQYSQPIPIQHLKLLLLTRIPIQISTIKQSNYYPLINGQLWDQLQFQRSESLLKLEDVKKQINFGWFEEVLRNLKNESLYVISIFGRQSVGKSSLLNRMFGTRFGVSVSRCTDGVWLGYTSLNDTQILVLDCEGLFSVRRSKADELKLLQQITLISDFSILLAGLEAIDKPFQELLNDLILSNKNKKGGDIYFQGSLEILVKDMNGQNDSSKIQKELTPIYNLKIDTNIHYLYPYYHEGFNNNLKLIRNQILSNLNKKQQKAEQTLSIFKYSIAQLFLDDDTDIELLYHKLEIKDLTNQFKQIFLDINKLKLAENESQINFTYQGNKSEQQQIKQIDQFDFDIEEEKEQMKDQKLQDLTQIPLSFDQTKLKLGQDRQQSIISINRIFLQKIFDDQFSRLKMVDHNNYYKQLQNFFNEVFSNRKQLVMNAYDAKLTKLSKLKAISNEFKNELDQFISELNEQFQICQKNCKECERRCVKQNNHISDCDCQTSHTCIYLCQECTNENQDNNIVNQDNKIIHQDNSIVHKDNNIIDQDNNIVHQDNNKIDQDNNIVHQDNNYLNPHQCQFLFGHLGTHLCSTKTHFCDQTCQISSCQNQCKLKYNHSHLIAHDCQQKHQCKYNCKLHDKCKKTCQLEDGHMEEDHLCNSDKCFEKCVLCDKQCSFNKHDHANLILDPIKNKQLLTLKYINEQNYEVEVIVDAHLCGESHLCLQLCQKEGICNISYQTEQKSWVSQELKRLFSYNFYKPQNQQQKCSIVIPKWQRMHRELIHQCSQQHRCNQKCPECLSFCKKDYNHEGKHQADIHRNKEQCVFLNKTEDKISINDPINQRSYKAGESAEPENCYDSCLRQGRAHFHLRECLGGDLCAQSLFPFDARHSKSQFYPYINKQYDEILCKKYWNSIDWETPLFNKLNQEYETELCNYACSHKQHLQQNKKMNFCTKKAWHQGIHNIKKSNCQHQLIYDNKIQICFTVDTTSSMGQVFGQMKASVENIVNSLNIQDFDIKFGIVCYRDHPNEETSYGETGLKIFQFVNRADVLEVIKNLDARGGGDIPENVICALYQSCNSLKWNKQSLNIIIHIGDAPPHGLEYGVNSNNLKWTLYGCPCGIKRVDVFNQLKSKNIKYFMVKCSSVLNETEKLFKKDFGEFFRKAVEISNFNQINEKITEFVIKEVQSNLEFYHVQPYPDGIKQN
ncbi:hypothetical protein TTHERM_00257000 (macronuclear) [Tetrahymena thermophila SB210]|uniref:VLIG-type G domain-containing protein n=1 Tax=Tetrahymena thermophila (strain SB210) TaxID=312017 RepID=Q23QH8_TETTS|nr:hypothetical protein TTHERM_00257000 [Tetrahymena thermophila SB210]EAR98910.2 hypothetical protein TTHERM_00257000 [Tetrahymena thermophila SB210]|eukprot:XP_001019155.2 hypothetical protein TTHERM_00257000 [Tetrahymena thermophila SB210]